MHFFRAQFFSNYRLKFSIRVVKNTTQIIEQNNKLEGGDILGRWIWNDMEKRIFIERMQNFIRISSQKRVKCIISILMHLIFSFIQITHTYNFETKSTVCFLTKIDIDFSLINNIWKRGHCTTDVGVIRVKEKRKKTYAHRNNSRRIT